MISKKMSAEHRTIGNVDFVAVIIAFHWENIIFKSLCIKRECHSRTTYKVRALLCIVVIQYITAVVLIICVLLSGRWQMLDPGLCVVPIWTCKIIITYAKFIIIIIVICDSAMSYHWLVGFKLSPALSTLWAQHCSGGRQTTTYRMPFLTN